MSTKGKVKLYKNPSRNKPDTQKPYVPQYQIMGVEPQEYKSPLAPGYAVKVAEPSADNPRKPRAMMRQQPYAEAVTSPIGRGRGPLPNVGNNMEQTWSSVDGEIVDDISMDHSDQPMVDNNEFVSNEALGLPPEPPLVVEEDRRPFVIETEEEPEEEDSEDVSFEGDGLYQALRNVSDGEYLLLIKGEVFASGPLDGIRDAVRQLVYGEHPEYPENPVPVDDILVIKKAKIEVGVFLEWGPIDAGTT